MHSAVLSGHLLILSHSRCHLSTISLFAYLVVGWLAAWLLSRCFEVFLYHLAVYYIHGIIDSMYVVTLAVVRLFACTFGDGWLAVSE